MRGKRLSRFAVAAILSCLAVVLVATATAHAASPPANDLRSKAVLLKTLPANAVGSTTGAKHEATDPSCGGPVRATVWYRFSRTAPGTILVSFQSLGQLDAVVSVYEQVGEQLKLLQCETSNASGKARFVFETHSSQKEPATYLLLVGQRVNSDPGKFRLAVSAPERPDNDELAGAVPLAALPAQVSGSTVGATRDVGDPSCAGGGPTVWYRFHRSVDGPLVARVQAGADLEASACVVEKVRSQLADGDLAADRRPGQRRVRLRRQGGRELLPRRRPGTVVGARPVQAPAARTGEAADSAGRRAALERRSRAARSAAEPGRRLVGGDGTRQDVPLRRAEHVRALRLGVDLPDDDPELRRHDAGRRNRLRPHVVLHPRARRRRHLPGARPRPQRADLVPPADPAGATGRHRARRAALERRAPIRRGVRARTRSTSTASTSRERATCAWPSMRTATSASRC